MRNPWGPGNGKFGQALVLVCISVGIALLQFLIPCEAQTLPDSVIAQINALEDEKASFPATDQKIESRLVLSIKRRRSETIAKGATPFLRVDEAADTNGMVEVEISAEHLPDVVSRIQKAGGQLRDEPFGATICARVPIEALRQIAALPEVKLINQAAEIIPNVIDLEGILSHDAAAAANSFGVAGGGVKVGVISDSVDFLPAARVANEAGPVFVAPGQSGVPGTGEGTALLEIVHAIAPDAALVFATAKPSVARFAANLLDLRYKYGCDIILDDVSFAHETPFQDGEISAAIANVAANGCLYLSAAGNEGNFFGNLYSVGSGVWEGDFADGGPAGKALKIKGRVHNFGGSASDTVTLQSGKPHSSVLFWSDPWGASDNDYDLFVLDAKKANVVAASINPQNGRQNPFEAVPAPKAGESLVIVLARGTNRFLHLTTLGGKLDICTGGATRGHNASTNALTIGAFYQYPEQGLEAFSSDGPRQMFFYSNGTPITPGNFSSSGGAIFQKPDFVGADGVATSVLNPFFGTSAAVANVAGVAALVKSWNPTLSSTQIVAALQASTQSDWNQFFGYGCPLADGAINAVAASAGPPSIALQAHSRQVELGTPYTINLTAVGAAPLSYQWQRNGVNLVDGEDFSGTTTNLLTIACDFLSDAGSYSVVVSNAFGKTSSSNALITFGPVQTVTSLAAISNNNDTYFFTEPGVVEGPDGYLYGATPEGGATGSGTLFRMNPDGELAELYDFSTNATEAASPNTPVFGTDGFLYGTTQQNSNDSTGIIFKMSPSGQFTTLYTFTNGEDGAQPFCGLTAGPNGVFYGTASAGGVGGSGTVYQITSTGKFKTLYFFTNNGDGASPASAPIPGRDGALYGTTLSTLYKLTLSGELTVLYTFTNGFDGNSVWAGLTAGADGNFYGVAAGGGLTDEFGNWGGTVFRITPAGKFTVLHSFLPLDGEGPVGKLALGPDGNFYGATTAGGPAYINAEETLPAGPGSLSGFGTVYKISPKGAFTCLHSFTTGPDNDGQYPPANEGVGPACDLFAASDGNIYGVNGGVFRVATRGFAPAIMRAPENQTVVPGANAAFVVAAGGAPPLTFQWQFKGANISGATDSSLTIGNVQPAQTGSYRVIVRDPAGTVTTPNATLSLGTALTISRQPMAETVAQGATATFTVAAMGSPPISYQWQFDGTNIPGATLATLRIPKVHANNAGSYTVVVGNPVGIATSGQAVLSISVPPTAALNARIAGLLFTNLDVGAATFYGLFIDTNAASPQSAGSLALSVSRTLAFSGKMIRASDVKSFTGRFDESGSAQLLLSQPNSGPVTLNLHLNPGAALEMSGSVRVANRFNAPLIGGRVLIGGNPIDSQRQMVALRDGSNRGHMLGRFEGDGKGAVKISLIDGTSVVARAGALESGRTLVFAPLYEGKGWFWSSDAAPVGDSGVSGFWLRPGARRALELKFQDSKN